MNTFKIKPLVAAISVSLVASSVVAQEDVVEEVVVKGFRQSLQQSLSIKRDAVNTSESIVAEDIGKMPDQNLAEAIQRVPGVAIVREGGEGRQISLRGLGAAFTHVTLNGMEVPSSAGGLDSSGGVNRGRGFDFNVFSADLFRRIDINKSAMASIEEGGIAGSVELYTMRPLDNADRVLAVSGQIGYNDLSEENDPRLTFIYSDTNSSETVGWMISAAYTERTVFQDGFGTVRWDSPHEDGTEVEETPDDPCDRSNDFAGNNTSLTDCEVNSLWYPRLPRQDSFHHNQERLGLSGALQFKPTDTLEFGVNYVSSEFDATVDAYNSFAQFRRNAGWGWPAITVEDVTVATQGGQDYAIAGEFTGVGLRTESRRQTDTTEFTQITADLKWDISDDLVLSAMIGNANSEFFENYFRANIEANTATEFSYDFTRDANVAALTYNIDVADVNNFFIQNNERIWDYLVDRDNDTQRVDLNWSLNDENSVKFGVMLNDREVNSVEYRGDVDPSSIDLSTVARVHRYDDAGGYGSDTALDFVVLDFGAAIPAFGTTATAARGPGIQTWTVQEETTGTYVDYNLNTELGGKGFRLNAGVRHVKTDVTATGWLSQDTANVETNSFNNTLPSLNIAYDVTEDMILRLGMAKTLTRPGMSSLVPSKSYSDVNFTVSGGNSQLEPLLSNDVNLSWEWYFGDESVLAFNYFTKDIDSFISSPTTFGPLRAEDRPIVESLYPGQPELLDPTLEWEYSTSSNTEGTDLDGWEIAYQQAFTFLPGFWSNLGLLANYSSVDATTMVDRGEGPESAPLPGLSENSYNVTLYYEVDTWGSRIAMNNRDDYVTSNIGSNHNYSEATTGPTHVDFTSFYNLTDNVTLTFEVINLTDEYERLYTTGPAGTMNLVREYNHTGRQFFLGVRATF